MYHEPKERPDASPQEEEIQRIPKPIESVANFRIPLRPLVTQRAVRTIRELSNFREMKDLNVLNQLIT